MKKIALGKGLDALIGERSVSISEEDIPVRMISVDSIRESEYQPRKKFDEDADKELMKSIQEKGIIQPLLVNKEKEGFQLIAGERRLRAVKKLGIKQVPVLIKEVKGKEEILELSLIENIQREDLNPIEKAESYQRLMKEFEYTQQMVADKVGKERSSVANTIRILELEEEIKEMVRNGKLNFGQARTLLSISDKEERLRLADKASSGDISVRELERLSSKVKIKNGKKKIKYTLKDPNVEEAEARLRNIFQTKVSIAERGRGSGRIIIEYFSPKERNNIINIILNK